MPDLERELRELGRAVAFPETADIATAVRHRLAAERAPVGRFGFRRPALVALAVLAVAVGAVMAVPQARTAILEWLGLRGVAIELVDTAPTVTRTLGEVDDLGLGEPVSLADARRRAAYPVVVPPAGLGAPEGIYFDERVAGGQVAFVYVEGEEVRLLVSEFRARLDEGVIRKAVGPGTRVQPVTVAGQPGWWLEGEPHQFAYVDRETGEVRFESLRLAGNTLLWQRGDVTLRLEGRVSRQDALAIAEAVE